jgi:hypothetical protein
MQKSYQANAPQQTRNDNKQTNTVEKKGEVLTSVLQNGGFSASMTV